MEALLATVEAIGLIQHLRSARWTYAVLNAAHVLGLAMLVGAILPYDLRLMGVWRDVPLDALGRVVVPVAIAGLTLATITGALLFAVRAREYAALGVFQLKLVLVAAGTLAALLGHWRHGGQLAGASQRQLATHGAISMTCWLGALLCGRLIAYAGD